MTMLKSVTPSDYVTIGNRERITSTALGKVEGIITTKEGTMLAKVMLDKVLYILQSKFNLLSLTKIMSNRWSIIGKNNHLVIEKNNIKVNFDIIINTKHGRLFCVNI